MCVSVCLLPIKLAVTNLVYISKVRYVMVISRFSLCGFIETVCSKVLESFADQYCLQASLPDELSMDKQLGQQWLRFIAKGNILCTLIVIATIT